MCMPQFLDSCALTRRQSRFRVFWLLAQAADGLSHSSALRSVAGPTAGVDASASA